MKMTILFLRSVFTAGALAAWTMTAFGAASRAAVANNAPAPELSLSLRVTVRLESSGGGNGIVELAPASGTWIDAIAVELSAAGGGAALARATAVGTPSTPRATLDRNRVAGGLWMFPASVTQRLARGGYVVRARLSIEGGAGWSGDVSSEEAEFEIVEVSPVPERVIARMLARAQSAFSQGAFEEAARLLDSGLEKTPDEFELLCLRAEIALAGRNPMAAMICVNRAARILAPKSPGPPPAMLHDVQSRVLAAQLAQTASPGNVPAWTWPPLSVLRLPEKEAAGLLAKTASLPGGASASMAPASVPVTASAPIPTASASPRAAAPASSASATPPPATASGPVAASIGTVVPAADLADAKIRADTNGQWATSATAGSQYGRTGYSAAQATGAPNVPVAGNSPDAWCPAVRDKGVDWLEVIFAKPVRATEVRVRQNDASGAIAKVEAFEPDGTAHIWWEGVDPYKMPGMREIVWFAVRVPRTAYLVARVKLTLNLASGPGYKEIDAVQLVGATP